MMLGADIPPVGFAGARAPEGLLTPAEADAAAVRTREMALSDVRGAIDHAERLLTRTGSGSPERSRLLAARAHALCYANRFEEAVAHLDEARAISERHGAAGELGPLWLTQVQPLARLGRLPDAAEAARRARAAFDAAGQPAMGAKAAVNLGIVLRMTGRHAEALACFDEAEAALPDEPLARGMLASNRAEALLDLNRDPEARVAFEAALRLLEAAGHAHAAAVVGGNLADLLSRTGEIDEALPRFDRAVAGLERAGAKADAARLLAEEADALLAAGAFLKSRRLFDRSLPVLKEAGLTREACRAMVGAAVTRMKTGDRDGAAALLNECVSASAACGAGPLLAESRLALAELALADADHPRARALARAALGGAELGPLFVLRVEATLAAIDLRAGESRAALRRVEGCLERRDAPGLAALAPRLLHLKALALAALGERAAANNAFREAIRSAERRRGAIRAEQLRTAFLESSGSLYADAFSFALDGDEPGAVARAFDAAALLKARTLNEDRLSHRRDDPTDAEHRACAARLNAIYTALGPAPKSARADSAAMQVELLELEARLDRLEDRRERLADVGHDSVADPRGTGGSADGVPAQATRLERLSESLGTEQAVVLYATDRAHVSALVVTDGGAEVFRNLIPRDAAAALARRLAFEVDRAHAGGRAPGLDGLRRVGDALLAPLQGAIAGRKAALVACAGLHGLPLTAAATLCLPGEAWMSPSPFVRSAAAGPETGRVLVIGVPDEAAPTAADEAAAVAALHRGAVLLTGREAGSERIFAELPEAGLVHFAGHAVFDADFPMSSRLRGADRWIAARELRGRLRPGATVVLSGCETGQMTGGEDRYGLARAFLGNGASAVVGGLWRLRDDFARRFFSDLHADLAQLEDRSPASLASCLGSAQRRASDQGTPWPLWAGLYVKGVIP